MDKNIKEVLTRKDISKRVGNKLGVRIEDIDTILSTFVDCVEEALIEDKAISIVRLGKFTPYRTELKQQTGFFADKGVTGGNRSYRFTRSDYLIRKLRDAEKETKKGR